ncbi:MAG: hypothetical protein Q8T09_24070 [Candidatus Melainabacteria bacterium]|nr:hypothetical protein [Candidatus Melainabacteria bacterium]
MELKLGDRVLLKDVWPIFESQVPNDAIAADIIFKTLEEQGGIVCRCSCSQVVRESGSRIFKCLKCKYETWFTANTALKRTSNLRAWLAAIYLKQNRVIVTPSQLARLTDISQTGAYEIHKKLNFVVCDQIEDDSPLMPSELFRAAICKRSRETPARLHPVAEELTALVSEDSINTTSSVSPIVDDCSLHESGVLAITGGGSIAAEELPSASASSLLFPVKLVGTAIAFFKRHFHGISRKYLQLYLAGFCFQFESGERVPDSLLTACLRHPPVSYDNLLDYVTSPLVKFPLVC